MAERASDGPGTSLDGKPSVVRRAVLLFAAWSLAALVIVAAGTVAVAGGLAREQALREAEKRAIAIATTIVAPMVNAKVRADVPGAGDGLTEVLLNRMRDGSVSHIKLWSEDGRLIWADDKALVGRRFPLSADVAALFGTTQATAEVSNLEKSENVRERDESQLLEVYVGTFDADGVPMLYEAYLDTEPMHEVEREILVAFLPVALGGLLLFQLAVLPAAVALARRVERSQLDRSRAIRHALMTSDLERRRIAQDLHDGVLPDLAGIGYVLPSVEAQLESARVSAGTLETVRRVSGVIEADIAALRTLLSDLYPDLEGRRLAAAVQELADSMCRDTRTAVAIDIPPDLDLPVDAARLAYRVVREGLRNAVKHAAATEVTLQVHRDGDVVWARVVDNGRGVQGGAQGGRGHLGLRLLAATLDDVRGRLALDSVPTGGAVLTATFPVALALE